MVNIAVVGDVFGSVANQKNILTYTDAVSSLLNGTIKQGHLSIEQGVSEEKVDAIKNSIQKLGLENSITIKSYFDNLKRCQNQLTHKVKSFNTLISEPLMQPDSSYKSNLMIDERCAELSDHVTGLHIQGMLLIEAARQMTTATIEKYFIDQANKPNIKIVMNDFQSNFYHYAFPFNVELDLRVINERKINNTNRAFTVLISIYQYEKEITKISRKVSIYDAHFVDYKEKVAMEESINYVLNYENSRVNYAA